MIAVGGTSGLQVVLTGAFAVQVSPSLWAAFREPDPARLSVGTWRLVLGEVLCWLLFGLWKADAALTVLGVTGTCAALAMILRAQWVADSEPVVPSTASRSFTPPTSAGSVPHR